MDREELIAKVNERKNLVQETTAKNVYADLQEQKNNHTLKNNFFLFDVRNLGEWHQGHIAGAMHFNINDLFIANLEETNSSMSTVEKKTCLEQLKEYIPDNNKDVEIVCYCHSGLRSTLAAYTLKSLGYNNVSTMTGGIISWLDNHYPIVLGQ